MYYLEILELLKNDRFRNFDFTKAKSALLKEKGKFKKYKNSEQLKIIWFILISLEIIELYFNAFNKLKNREYYKAWDILEKIEIKINNVKFNDFDISVYWILQYIEIYTTKFQKLYPYKVFGSPEIVEKRVECSVCGKTIIPWSDCEHILGKVYDGEICYGIVKDMDFISVSIVTKPSQKYSVIFEDIENPTKYLALEYLIPKLKTKYICWDYEVFEKFEPYSKYQTKKDDFCPCHSGKKFKDCCLKNGKGIKYPHYEFILPYGKFGI